MDPRAILTIATSAKDDYVEIEAQNANLKQMLDSQKVLINDFAVSMPDIDETEKKAAELDEELSQVEEQLVQSQSILTELLQTKQPKQSSQQAETILKAVMKTFQGRVMDLTKEAVEKGQASATVFQLIDLEEEISKLIENFESKDMYPETKEENDARTQQGKEHTAKLAQYLQLLRQIIAQANAQKQPETQN